LTDQSSQLCGTFSVESRDSIVQAAVSFLLKASIGEKGQTDWRGSVDAHTDVGSNDGNARISDERRIFDAGRA
jgi:hypothetical protein